ncbi:MAG: DUF4981 domain-containing protein [Armatimonadetes bacterium]|nr:DUF4981 domain-containing protein [Armatimonadota bacterium]
MALAREFEVPADWAGRRVILRFDAIHAGTRYFVNGRCVGESQNLFTPVELDVTDAIRPGKANRLDLEMLVDTIPERLSYASGYPFHNLGGIHRSVHPFALPAVHIRHLSVTQDLDRGYTNATLTVEADLENCSRRPAQGLYLGIRLYDPEGTQVALGATSRADVGALAPGGLAAMRLTAGVPAPQKWSAEKPALYRLVVDLKQGRRLLERIERRIGFRKVEVRDGQLWVNGRRVKLAGANHHEIDPLTGRADTLRHAERDVRLMKAANLNYLRTSHYPPTLELLDAADRLGMYVEVEAPFCWVTGDPHDAAHLRAVLDATSAMIDYHGGHPSVIIWSLANESQFNWLFEQSHRLVKALDPSRPTTFNNPDPKRICDIANLHYPGMPYDQHLPDDPRPILIDEYFFPVCHEQTDVAINPGLRELWGAGHSDPDSPWGRECAASFKVYSGPGAPPGAWTHIVHSNRVIGGAIWAFIDDSFYLPDGRHVGYSWVHGFWGLVDAWRRPKPEWWLAKLIFSPVWFPTRRLPFTPGADTVTVPVENRYSFTNLSELTIEWELRGRKGYVVADVPPGATGELRMPLPRDAVEGDVVIVRVRDAHGELVNVAGLQLGERQPHPVPTPSAGPPRWADDGETLTIQGDDFAFVVDRRTGQLRATDPRHRAAVMEFPSVHLTRFDFGDLVPSAPPYVVLPDPATRVVEAVEVQELPYALEVSVRDRYAGLAGTVRWVLDRAGMGHVSADYTYTGEDFHAREVGLRFLLRPGCETLAWRRWSEWAVYPEDSISRTEGTARARRDPALGRDGERTPPRWPWALDETELGTNDFRGVKMNIYEASLTADAGDGLHVSADADRHVRACLDPRGVWLHVLIQCRLGPVIVHRGDRITADCVCKFLPRR